MPHRYRLTGVIMPVSKFLLEYTCRHGISIYAMLSDSYV
jgi:hypothetical protein